jgi:hypothetical protein
MRCTVPTAMLVGLFPRGRALEREMEGRQLLSNTHWRTLPNVAQNVAQ